MYKWQDYLTKQVPVVFQPDAPAALVESINNLQIGKQSPTLALTPEELVLPAVNHTRRGLLAGGQGAAAVTTYLVRRVLQAVVVLVLISMLVFGFRCLLPGGPQQAILAGNAGGAQLGALRHDYGIGSPAVVEYLHWLGQVLHGNLGYSYVAERQRRFAARGQPAAHARADAQRDGDGDRGRDPGSASLRRSAATRGPTGSPARVVLPRIRHAVVLPRLGPDPGLRGPAALARCRRSAGSGYRGRADRLARPDAAGR